MVGALPLDVFKPLHCLVQGLPISLIEGGDISPQFCSFFRQEVFAKEYFRKDLLGSEWVRLLILQLVTGSILQWEGEELQSNCIGGHPIEFDGVTFRKEFTKVHTGVFRGVPTELVLLHKGDECRVKLEIISLNHCANNVQGDSRCLRQTIIPQHHSIFDRPASTRWHCRKSRLIPQRLGCSIRLYFLKIC